MAKNKYINPDIAIDESAYAEWGDREYDRLMVDIDRYVPIECNTIKEFFDMAVSTMCSSNGINADSKKWDKQYKEVLGYMLHPNGKGIDEYLNYTYVIGFDRAHDYNRALKAQGFLEATREYKQETRYKQQYAIKMSKQRKQQQQ